MQGLPNELLQWLYRVLQAEYIDPRTTYQDSAVTLQSYPTLKPRTRVYVNEIGESKLLLNIYGSLPCEISGKTYKIPVELWIPHEYPIISPIVYVVPTEAMILKPGNYVDGNGKCYHPYLSAWNPSQDQSRSTIVKLSQELSRVFSLEPPVFAKPIIPSTPLTSNNPVNSPSPSRPALPPKKSPKQEKSSPLSPPPLPPLPEDLRRKTVVSPTLTKINYDSRLQTQQQMSQMADQPNIMDDILKNEGEDTARREILNEIDSLVQKLYQEEVARNLDRFKTGINQIRYSIDKFNKIFEYEFHNLENVNSQLKENEVILLNSIKQADETITKANEFGELNVDEIICAETIVHNQLYSLVAEDLAISETLYALTKAFDNGKIPLNSFVKFTRNLAREQFMKKALINKIVTVLKLQ